MSVEKQNMIAEITLKVNEDESENYDDETGQSESCSWAMLGTASKTTDANSFVDLDAEHELARQKLEARKAEIDATVSAKLKEIEKMQNDLRRMQMDSEVKQSELSEQETKLQENIAAVAKKKEKIAGTNKILNENIVTNIQKQIFIHF
jgi:hypothetical protein